MDEQDLDLDLDDLDFDDLEGDPQAEAEPEIFYWALKAALERKPVETAPGMGLL